MQNLMLQLFYFIFAAELLPWEVWFRGFCIGFLIFGSAVIVLVLVTFGISTGHSLTQDFDSDTDITIDKDVTIDKDLSVDKDITIDKDIIVDKDVSMDKDIDLDHDIDIDGGIEIDSGPFHVEKGGTAPLMLLLAVFSVSFGGLGLLLFWQEPEMNSYLRLTVTLLSPIVLSIITDLLWRRISKTETYRLPKNSDFIGREATVSIKVNSGGGLIRVEIPDQLEPLKVPAKTLHKQQEFLPDEQVYIVSVDGNYYLVDDSPDTLKKKDIVKSQE